MSINSFSLIDFDYDMSSVNSQIPKIMMAYYNATCICIVKCVTTVPRKVLYQVFITNKGTGADT